MDKWDKYPVYWDRLFLVDCKLDCDGDAHSNRIGFDWLFFTSKFVIVGTDNWSDW